MTRRIGVLTAGSDCPGLNAAIRALGKSAANDLGMELIGFQDGFEGLVHNHFIQPALSGILTLGGTLLGTSRETPHEMTVKGESVDLSDSAVRTYQEHNLEALVCIGGIETQESAYRLSQKGLNVITLPKGVDNDVAFTDVTIGFDTAMSIATEAIDRLHSTAHSHHRIILVEILGKRAGWLTLGSGVAGGADVIILPEIPYDIQQVVTAILDRNTSGKRFSIVAVSEGGISKDTVDFFNRSKNVNHRLRSGEDAVRVDEQLNEIETRMDGSTIYLANRLEKFTGLDTRITILGHLLRGGAPSAADRVLATNLGTACVQLIAQKQFGVMIASRSGDLVTIPLKDMIGQLKTVPLTHPWIESARRVGTHLGD